VDEEEGQIYGPPVVDKWVNPLQSLRPSRPVEAASQRPRTPHQPPAWAQTSGSANGKVHAGPSSSFRPPRSSSPDKYSLPLKAKDLHTSSKSTVVPSSIAAKKDGQPVHHASSSRERSPLHRSSWASPGRSVSPRRYRPPERVSRSKRDDRSESSRHSGYHEADYRVNDRPHQSSSKRPRSPSLVRDQSDRSTRSARERNAWDSSDERDSRSSRYDYDDRRYEPGGRRYDYDDRRYDAPSRDWRQDGKRQDHYAPSARREDRYDDQYEGSPRRDERSRERDRDRDRNRDRDRDSSRIENAEQGESTERLGERGRATGQKQSPRGRSREYRQVKTEDSWSPEKRAASKGNSDRQIGELSALRPLTPNGSPPPAPRSDEQGEGEKTKRTIKNRERNRPGPRNALPVRPPHNTPPPPPPDDAPPPPGTPPIEPPKDTTPLDLYGDLEQALDVDRPVDSALARTKISAQFESHPDRSIPHAPNRNLLQPTTRVSTPARLVPVSPYEVPSMSFRRPTEEEELRTMKRRFFGTTTLAAYDIGSKLGEGTFG
jgi:hypothetical protein